MCQPALWRCNGCICYGVSIYICAGNGQPQSFEAGQSCAQKPYPRMVRQRFRYSLSGVQPIERVIELIAVSLLMTLETYLSKVVSGTQ